MKVLHRNKDSLMAVLEAFVYDPLLNWRLMENNHASSKCKRAQHSASHSQEQISSELNDSVSAMLHNSATNKMPVANSVENIGNSNFFIVNELFISLCFSSYTTS